MTKVTMINSVGEHVAGEEVDLPDEEADRYIVLGWADGQLTRDYTVDERNTMGEGHQEVSA